jgi:Fe-S cluster assembly protein SufD
MQATTPARGASVHIDWGNPQSVDWVQGLRERGAREFEARGFPTQRHEDWKYTDVTPIARGPMAAGVTRDDHSGILSTEATAAAQARCNALGIQGPRLVFVDGDWSSELSAGGTPAGVELRSLAHGGWGLAQGQLGEISPVDVNPFVALNTGRLHDGAVILVHHGQTVETPIHLVFLSTSSAHATHPRVLVVGEEASEATVVETYASLDSGECFTNPVTEVQLESGAILHHSRVLAEGDAALHVGVVDVELHEASNFHSLHVAAAGRLTRTDLNVIFAGEGAECSLNGLYIASAGRHVDNHTLIDHAVPRCTSRQLYKGVIGDQATGVFNGKVMVRPGAQKTDANQTNKNLLLSTRATVDTKPQLEIFADDIRCTHGATVGPPDPETLFYLQSRGLNPAEASRLFAYGFGADVLSDWPLRASLEAQVTEHIEAAVMSGSGAGR